MIGETTRPTGDRVKEAFFNIIAPQVAQSKFADVFAGSGNIGCEALSRGAQRVTFIDIDPKCKEVILKNAKKVSLDNRVDLYNEDYKTALRRLKEQDIVYIDPPYNKGLGTACLELIAKYDILSKDGIAVLEHDNIEQTPENIGKLVRYDSRKYGRCILSFYRRTE